MAETVMLHPNHGERVVTIEGRPYHWDGALCAYRPGYGPYSTTTMIGDWTAAKATIARRIRREVRTAA